MVIKNKNGTPFTLRGPNPIMKEQSLWDDFLLHNMNFPEDVIINNNKEISRNKSKLNLGKTITETKDDSNRTVIKLDSTPQIQEVKKEELVTQSPILADQHVERPNVVNEKLLQYKRTVIHCMPADADVKIDDLYGERSVKIKYGNKFNFEAILIQEDDFNLRFWTHLDKVTAYSILYPKNKDKRWWKVLETKKAPEGFFISCMPSDHHPNFDQ